MPVEPHKEIRIRAATPDERARSNEWYQKQFERAQAKGDGLIKDVEAIYEVVSTGPGRANIRHIAEDRLVLPSDARREVIEVACAALNQHMAKQNGATPGRK